MSERSIETRMGHLKISLSKEVQARLASQIKHNNIYFKPTRENDAVEIRFDTYYENPFRKAFDEPKQPVRIVSPHYDVQRFRGQFVHWVWDEKEKADYTWVLRRQRTYLVKT